MKISAPTPSSPQPTRQSRWQGVRRQPIIAIAGFLHSHRPSRISSPKTNKEIPERVEIVCISDTHNSQSPVPDGDVLLHAGDLTNKGTFEELQAQLTWLASLPHAHKIVIAGNHDCLLDADFVDKHPERIVERPGTSRADLKWHDIIYLESTSVTVTITKPNSSKNVSSSNGAPPTPRETNLKIFGSPSTPSCGTFAFQYPPIRDVWRDRIPDDTDIVIVHGPPRGFLDRPGPHRDPVGCPHLTRELRRVKPRLFVCGHIHSAHGVQDVRWGWTLDDYYSLIMGVGNEVETVATRAHQWVLVVEMVIVFCFAWLGAFFGRIVRRTRPSRQDDKNLTTMMNAAMKTHSAESNDAKVFYF